MCILADRAFENYYPASFWGLASRLKARRKYPVKRMSFNRRKNSDQRLNAILNIANYAYRQSARARSDSYFSKNRVFLLSADAEKA